jgi:hypothetical protein
MLQPLELSFADTVALSLVNGDGNEALRMHDEDSVSETESDVSQRSKHSSMGATSPDRSDSQWKYNALRSYYDEVISIIDNLFDVSIFIRGASNNLRWSRAASHVEKGENGSDMLARFRTIGKLCASQEEAEVVMLVPMAVSNDTRFSDSVSNPSRQPSPESVSVVPKTITSRMLGKTSETVATELVLEDRVPKQSN